VTRALPLAGGAGLAVAALLLSSAPAVALEAVLQGLDKVTARISTIDAPIGKMVRFGTLEVTVAQCAKKPPDEPPETAAFLTVVDNKPGGQQQQIFSGWMFASSPSLNALEHPVFDVWVLDCKQDPPPPQAAPTRPAQPAPAAAPARPAPPPPRR
jgi:hypothetical protein